MSEENKKQPAGNKWGEVYLSCTLQGTQTGHLNVTYSPLTPSSIRLRGCSSSVLSPLSSSPFCFLLLSLSLSLVECSAEIQAVQDRTGLLVWTLFMFFCLLCAISLGSGHLVLERLEICCIIIGSLLPVVCWSSINWGFSGSCFGISSYHFLGWFWLMYFPTNSFHAWSSWWLIHSGFRLSAAILLFVFSPPPNCLLYGTESSSLCFLDAFLYAFF